MVASWFLRPGDAAYAPDIVPAVLSVSAVTLALVTAWLGGELVYRLRVCVDADAHVDASNSLDRDGLVSVTDAVPIVRAMLPRSEFRSRPPRLRRRR